MFDVLEHMERDEGEKVVKLLEGFNQAVIFVPLGFQEQDHDPWGYEEHDLQTHKSGWTPDDFKDWETRTIPGFHKGKGAFWAWRT